VNQAHAHLGFIEIKAPFPGLVDQSIANVRELTQRLRPVILDDFGLEAGLQWLAESFSMRTRLGVDFEADGVTRYSDETETYLLRINQEPFTKTARHSEATAVVVRLYSNGATVLISRAPSRQQPTPLLREVRELCGSACTFGRSAFCPRLRRRATTPRLGPLRRARPSRPCRRCR
jgi:hypothetical protein